MKNLTILIAAILLFLTFCKQVFADDVYYLHLDYVGSVSLITSNGEVVQSNKYFPFGETKTGGIQNRELVTEKSYTGQISDMVESGLMYFNSRYYEPSVAHFFQPDTLVANPTNQSDWNRYLYVRNNPITLIDPSGHRPCGNTGNDISCEEEDFEEDWRDSLSFHGREVYNDYLRLMQKKGWWNNYGKQNMSYEDFLGLMIYWETKDLSGAGASEAFNYVKEAAVNGLWMELTKDIAGSVYARDAICKGGCTADDIFNYLGSEADPYTQGGHITMRVDQLLGGNFFGDVRDLRETAQSLGAELTRSHQITPSKNVPLHWGVPSDQVKKRLNKSSLDQGYNGTGATSIIYWMDAFIVFTPNQAATWNIY